MNKEMEKKVLRILQCDSVIKERRYVIDDLVKSRNETQESVSWYSVANEKQKYKRSERKQKESCKVKQIHRGWRKQNKEIKYYEGEYRS